MPTKTMRVAVITSGIRLSRKPIRIRTGEVPITDPDLMRLLAEARILWDRYQIKSIPNVSNVNFALETTGHSDIVFTRQRWHIGIRAQPNDSFDTHAGNIEDQLNITRERVIGDVRDEYIQTRAVPIHYERGMNIIRIKLRIYFFAEEPEINNIRRHIGYINAEFKTRELEFTPKGAFQTVLNPA